jgi:methylase of polypeptide subunit release factors
MQKRVSAAPPRRPWWKHAAGRALKRGLAWRYRHFRPDSEPPRWARVAGLRLHVDRAVFNPEMHFTSGFLAGYLARPDVVSPGGRVLDMGTGSGVGAIAAARAAAGPAVAVDINPAAVACAAGNVRRYGLAGRVDVRAGDLFAPVAGEQFDLILCNPPYFRGTPRTLADAAFLGGPQYEWLDRFAAKAGAHLAPGGRILVVLGDAADVPALLARLAAPGWRIAEVARRDLWMEMLYIYALTPRAEAAG